VDHAQSKGVIRTGSYLEKPSGFQCGNCLAYIDIGQLSAVVEHIQCLQIFGNTQRGEHIAANENEVFGVFDVVDKTFSTHTVKGKAGVVCVSSTGIVMVGIVG